MASAVKKTIGGKVWSFGILPATQAVRVEVAIARVIGEPMAKAYLAIQPGGSSDDQQMTTAGAAIGLLTSRMDADDLLVQMKTMFDVCSCDGQRIDIDSTFTGQNKLLWEVFFEALKVNFSDFFPAGLSASLAGAIPK